MGECIIFVPMEKTIYKFLDEYLGDEVNCVNKSSMTGMYYDYGLYSKKGKSLIMSFRVCNREGHITMFRGRRLTEMVSDFFSMDPNKTSSIIRDWFGDKHNLKKVGDLMKFVN